MGVDIRGRSHTLRVNYRTSHQIRRQADRLLPPETSDVDGNTDRRTGTVSVFNGAEPAIQVLPSHDAETAAIAEWLKSRGQEGYAPHEMGVFVRSKTELDRAIAAVEAAGHSAVDLAQHAGGVSAFQQSESHSERSPVRRYGKTVVLGMLMAQRPRH